MFGVQFIMISQSCNRLNFFNVRNDLECPKGCFKILKRGGEGKGLRPPWDGNSWVRGGGGGGTKQKSTLWGSLEVHIPCKIANLSSHKI